MLESESKIAQGSASTGAAPADLEARLRHFFGEQRRLASLLEEASTKTELPTSNDIHGNGSGLQLGPLQTELARINAELSRFQDEYCTDAAREEEYDNALRKILGFEPRLDLNEIEEILVGRRACEMGRLIEELKGTVNETASPGIR